MSSAIALKRRVNSQGTLSFQPSLLPMIAPTTFNNGSSGVGGLLQVPPAAPAVVDANVNSNSNSSSASNGVALANASSSSSSSASRMRPPLQSRLLPSTRLMPSSPIE
jgi:hypothetical protein